MRAHEVQVIDHPEQDSTQTQRTKRGASAVRIVIFSVVVMAAFLLGCFVIGPSIGRIQKPPSTVVTQDPQPLDIAPTGPPDETLQPPAPPARVVITEKKAPATEAEPPSAPELVITDPPTPAPPASIAPSVPPPAPAPEPSPAGPIYRVRAGLFADKARADALASRLTDAGFAPNIHPVDRDSVRLYSVQVGAYRNRDSAAALLQSLRASGFEATIATQ